MIKTPKFGDIVENGWASEDNPTRRGYFVRAYTTTGRMNRGLHWQITDKRGKFWDLQPKVIGNRLTVTPEPTPEPVAWAKPGFIYDRDGYSIGTDEPEVHWGATCPEDEPGYWAPLFSSPIRQQVGGGEEKGGDSRADLSRASSSPQPSPTGTEEWWLLHRLFEVAQAAQTYFDGYCQDEADDEGPDFTGCSWEQHRDAKALKAALADYSPEEALRAVHAAVRPEGEKP